MFRILQATAKRGLIFWRPNPYKGLPYHTWPVCFHESYKVNIPKESADPYKAYCVKDSSWATDINSRRSVSGIHIMFGGASVIYKTIIQRVVALSSTEAEFYALGEAGKLTLYL